MRDKTVAILESRLGKQFAQLAAGRGWRAVHAPALAEMPAIEPAAVRELLSDLGARPARVAVFQTGVGAAALFNATDALKSTARLLALLERMTVVVRGPKPAAILGGRGVRIDLSAKEPATTREVLEALDGVALRKKRVLVQRYGVANIELEETLKSRGAEVVEITTYRWALPADTRPLIDLVDAVERGAIDAVAITNAAQVYNLFALAERQGRTVSLRGALNRTLVGSIGPVTSGALMKFGVAVGVEASPPRLGQLLDALERALAGA